jgi:hypothetical protein
MMREKYLEGFQVLHNANMILLVVSYKNHNAEKITTNQTSVKQLINNVQA